MKAKECRNLTEEELDDRLREVRREHFGLRMQQASSQIEKPLRLRDLRREIARLETIRHERKRGGS